MHRMRHMLWLIVLTLLCVTHAGFAQTQPEDPFASDLSAYEQLERLLKVAPSRSLGSPGNGVIDRIVQERFEAVVRSKNDPAVQKQVGEKLKAAAKLNADWVQRKLDALLPGSAIGSPQIIKAGREALEADLAADELLKGKWQTGRIAFESAVFVPGKANISIGGKSVQLYQLAPNLVDPGNLPESGFQGPIVYAGKATPAALSGKQLEGAAVLVDFDSYNRWLDAIQLGAKVIIVIEPQTPADQYHATSKFSWAPISVPRFYLKRSDMAALFGDDLQSAIDAKPTIDIQQEPGRWASRTLYNDWLLVPPADPADSELSSQLVHIQAFKDCDSIVPAIAPGAASAANLVTLFRLLDHLEKNPPIRPVLLTVVNAHTNGLAGENEFAYTAFADPSAIEAYWSWLRQQLAEQQYISDIYGSAPTLDHLENLRSAATTVAGKSFKLNKPALMLLRNKRNVLRTEYSNLDLKLLDIRRHRDTSDEPGANEQARIAEIEARLAAIDDELNTLNMYMGLFNRFGLVTRYDELNEAQQAVVATFFEEIAEEAGRGLEDLKKQQSRLMQNLALRRQLRYLAGNDAAAEAAEADSAVELFAIGHPPLPGLMGICLDLNFGSPQLGFFPIGTLSPNQYQDRWAMNRVSRLARYTLAHADRYANETGQGNRIADTLRNVGGVPWNAYLSGNYAMSSRMFHLYDRTGLTLTSIYDSRSQVFTPHDTLANIDRKILDDTMAWMDGYLLRLINGDDLAKTRQTVGRPDPLTLAIDVRLLDEYAVGLPERPLKDGIVFIRSGEKSAAKGIGAYYGQVRPYEMHMTDNRGGVTYRCGAWRNGSVLVFKYDDDYRQMRATLDLGLESRYKSTLNDLKAGEIFKTRLLVTFDCRKVDLIGLTQPTNLMPISSMNVLDAQQDATPRHYSVGGMESGGGKTMVGSLDGAGCVMMQPDEAFKLLAGLSLVINGDEENTQGNGFSMDAGLLPDVVAIGAQDMWRLTDQRLALLESKGVVNETARQFNEQAGEQAELARKASEAGDHDKALTYSEKARGLAFWAYIHARNTINDLIKAVVIFLALILPFCFFVMKLITPYTDVNRQLSIFAAIFALMAVLLWSLHPAFKVAETPVVVILGFIIFGLAMFVAAILMGRFNSSMNQAIEQMQQSESVDASQSRLAGVGFLVGVNNMKRRRIRTSLTCATIILVTFTMLSVISVGQDVEPAKVRIGSDPPYTGILFSRPGLGPIDDMQMRRLRAHFQNDALTISRTWSQRLGSFGEYLDYRIYPEQADGAIQFDGPQLNAKVLLGVEPAEDGFLGPMPLTPGSRWFSSVSAEEIVLSVKAAQLLGITPENFRGKSVRLLGKRLKLVGLVDDEAMEAMKDLGDVPLLPLLTEASQSAGERSAQTRDSDQALLAETSGSASLDAGGDLMSMPGIQPARAIDIALLPLEFAQTLGDYDYRMMSVKYDGQGDASVASQKTWVGASELIRYQFARIDVGLEEPVRIEGASEVPAGRYSLASSSATQVGGVLKVAIPIILTATIIFNTMLGSVMERRREVGIYNAIGLNPGHVVMFFLAESLVFGLVGSVAGYLIGQALSLFITHFELIDLNLNYSSTSVLLVIFLTIATVLLSTVYPAMMAARAAVPSGQRRWSLPQPEGDEIHVQFPFSYDAERVKGVCAYLREYMQQHSEASTGNFLVNLGPVGRVANQDGEEQPYCMLFDVAPAPFDLGVNQIMEVYAFYNHQVKAHMLSVHLTRTSGEKNHWMAVNQPFLEALRKRLLGWRSQRQEIQESFYQQGADLFADTSVFPTRDPQDGKEDA